MKYIVQYIVKHKWLFEQRCWLYVYQAETNQGLESNQKKQVFAYYFG